MFEANLCCEVSGIFTLQELVIPTLRSLKNPVRKTCTDLDISDIAAQLLRLGIGPCVNLAASFLTPSVAAVAEPPSSNTIHWRTRSLQESYHSDATLTRRSHCSRRCCCHRRRLTIRPLGRLRLPCCQQQRRSRFRNRAISAEPTSTTTTHYFS